MDLVAGGVRSSLARDLTVAPGARLEVRDRFTRHGPVTIEVVYPSGHALAKDANVLLQRTFPGLDPGEAAAESLEGTLDENGRLEFASLAPGTWSCRIDREAPIEVEIRGDPIQQIVVPDRALLAGQILRRNEDPDLLYPSLAYHWVTFEITEGETRTTLMKQCDQDGRFRFDLLPVGVQGKLELQCVQGDVECAGLVAETGSAELILEFVGHPKTQTIFDPDGSFGPAPIRRSQNAK